MGENMRDPYKTMNRMKKVNKEWLGHHHFQLKYIQRILTKYVCSKPNKRYFIRIFSCTRNALTQRTQY